MRGREEVVEIIAASRFGELSERLVELLEPSIRMGVQPAPPDNVPLGASRIGGCPDLPASIEWPTFEGRPLTLVAQLSLAELAPYDVDGLLPPSGWLYFFFDSGCDAPFEEGPGGERSWRVLHFDGALGKLSRQAPPRAAGRRVFRSCLIGAHTEWTLPSFGSVLLDGLPFTEDDRRDYEDLVFALHRRPPLPARKAQGKVGRFVGHLRHWWIGDPIHRMLGHPEHFQLDPRLDWQRVAEHSPVVAPPEEHTYREAFAWHLLLQVDTYRDGPAWVWGDHGTCYFGIRQEDLAAGDFGNVQWTVECG